MQYLYQIALVTHLAGITTMAGSTVAAYVFFNRFWRVQANGNTTTAIPILDATLKLNKLFAIGILLLILSGVTMMYLTGGAYGEQVWFRIKFGLIVTVIMNGVLVGRRQGNKLTQTFGTLVPGVAPKYKLEKLKRGMTAFYLAQIVFFLLIYILSVFKFN